MFHGYSKATPAINATEIVMTLHGNSNWVSQYLPAAVVPSPTAGIGARIRNELGRDRFLRAPPPLAREDSGEG
jgi:hypothetical protein